MPLRENFEFIDGGEPWREKALCRDGTSAMIDLFFSVSQVNIDRAKSYCKQCPVIADCFEWASTHKEYGVWGGEEFDSGRVVVARNRRGRPPKENRMD